MTDTVTLPIKFPAELVERWKAEGWECLEVRRAVHGETYCDANEIVVNVHGVSTCGVYPILTRIPPKLRPLTVAEAVAAWKEKREWNGNQIDRVLCETDGDFLLRVANHGWLTSKNALTEYSIGVEVEDGK